MAGLNNFGGVIFRTSGGGQGLHVGQNCGQDKEAVEEAQPHHQPKHLKGKISCCKSVRFESIDLNINKDLYER